MPLTRNGQKQKVHLEFFRVGSGSSAHKTYRVLKLVNTLDPEIGSCLTENEVDRLIQSGRYEVTVTPAR